MPPVRYRSRYAAQQQYDDEPSSDNCCVLTSARAALIVAWLLSVSIAFYVGNLTHKCSADVVRRSALDEAREAVMGATEIRTSVDQTRLAARDVAAPTVARGLKAITPKVPKAPKAPPPPPPPASRSRSASRTGSNSASTSSSMSASPAAAAPVETEGAGAESSVEASPVGGAVAAPPQEVFYDQCLDQYRSAPYQWATYLPTDPVLEAARERMRQPTDEELKDTAFVTMATGDSAARGATVLMQV